MRTLLMILLLNISIPYNVHSQYIPMAVEGSHWIIGVDLASALMYDLDVAYEHLIEGDTIIDLIEYKKLWRRSHEVENGILGNAKNDESLTGFIRDDSLSRKVYFKSHDLGFLSFYLLGSECLKNDEILLYDFSLIEGKTIDLCQGPYMYEIPSVDTIENDFFGYVRTMYEIGELKYFIEGVGHEDGLLEDYVFNGGDLSFTLLDYCIGTDEECSIVLNMDDDFDKEQLSIIKTSANTYSVTSSKRIKTIQIYSIDGKKIPLKKLQENEDQILVELHEYSSSLKFIQLEYSNGTVYSSIHY